MTPRQKVRLALFTLIALVLAFVLGDVLGWWASDRGVRSPVGYVAIPHGSHPHYVPNGWTGDPPIGEFPTEPPPPGMTVGPTGQFVPAE